MTALSATAAPRLSAAPTVADPGNDDARRFVVGMVIPTGLIVSIIIGSGSLTLLMALCSIGAALVFPELGLMTLAVAAPLLSRPILPAPGYPIALVGAAFLGCLYRLPIERPKLRVSPAMLVALAFLLYVIVRQAPQLLAGYSSVDDHWTGSLMTKLLTGMFVVLDTALILRHRSVYPLIAALIVSGVATAMVAITTSSLDPQGILAALVAPSTDAPSRPSGSFGDPNEYGLFLSSVAVLCVGWLVSFTGRRLLRLLLVAALAVLAIGLGVSMSRTATISLLAGLVALAFARSWRAGAVATVGAIAIGVVIYPLLIDARVTASFGSVTSFGTSALAQSDQGRLARVLAGPALFISSPIFGVGLGGYQVLTGDASHNYYMTLLAEEGLVGSVLWGLVLVSVAYALRHRPPIARSIGYASFVVFLMGSMFLDPPHEDQMSVLMAAAVVAALVGDWGDATPEAHKTASLPSPGKPGPQRHAGVPLSSQRSANR
jgi:O-antigen ligase